MNLTGASGNRNANHMIEKTLQIKNKLGLHARAASQFVKTASAFGAEITVSNNLNNNTDKNVDNNISNVKQANGKSIMSMMLLQASCGSEITVSAQGTDEAIALEAIEALIDNLFGEAE